MTFALLDSDLLWLFWLFCHFTKCFIVFVYILIVEIRWTGSDFLPDTGFKYLASNSARSRF